MIELIKKDWLEALRSGDYEQGTKYLKNDGKYCCLGVLCQLFADEKKVHFDELDIDDEVLPINVAEWSGLCDVNPEVEFDGITEQISAFNDGANDMQSLNFKEIANLIEEQL